MDMVIATRNRKKAEEIKKILIQHKSPETAGTFPVINILTLEDFPQCPEIEEDGETFEANAVKKAWHVASYTGMITIADDSGLEVSALGGAPGVLSARYGGEQGNDRKNIEKLLQQMRGVPQEKREARFVCCIAIAFPDGNVRTFSGYVKGWIGREPIGENGFGYDPVFYPEGEERTFAQMSDDEKNAISHRGMALRQLQEYLSTQRGQCHP